MVTKFFRGTWDIAANIIFCVLSFSFSHLKKKQSQNSRAVTRVKDVKFRVTPTAAVLETPLKFMARKITQSVRNVQCTLSFKMKGLKSSIYINNAN